jgi:hypothetical protein
MSTQIGHVDIKNNILRFLKKYNKTKQIQIKICKIALTRLNIFINIFVKTLILNCSIILTSMKLRTLNYRVLLIVYDIMNSGYSNFDRKTFIQFDNDRKSIENSNLTYDSKKIMKTGIFHYDFKQLENNILRFCDELNSKISYGDAIIEFMLIKIFELSDGEDITAEKLEKIGNRPEFIQLDQCLGGYDILSVDKITE